MCTSNLRSPACIDLSCLCRYASIIGQQEVMQAKHSSANVKPAHIQLKLGQIPSGPPGRGRMPKPGGVTKSKRRGLGAASRAARPIITGAKPSRTRTSYAPHAPWVVAHCAPAKGTADGKAGARIKPPYSHPPISGCGNLNFAWHMCTCNGTCNSQ